jgi:hypothetical protein
LDTQRIRSLMMVDVYSQFATASFSAAKISLRFGAGI